MLTLLSAKWNLMMQNDCFGRVGRQLHIYGQHLFGYLHHLTCWRDWVIGSSINWRWLHFFPWMSSNQANDYGSLGVKQLKVKFTGKFESEWLSLLWPCDKQQYWASLIAVTIWYLKGVNESGNAAHEVCLIMHLGLLHFHASENFWADSSDKWDGKWSKSHPTQNKRESF